MGCAGIARRMPVFSTQPPLLRQNPELHSRNRCWRYGLYKPSYTAAATRRTKRRGHYEMEIGYEHAPGV